MEKEVLRAGILYLGLHNQLIKKYGAGGIVTTKDFFCKLGKHGQIPKGLRWIVINEMEEKKLIKKINKNTIQILGYDFDIEENINKLYEMAGLF